MLLLLQIEDFVRRMSAGLNDYSNNALYLLVHEYHSQSKLLLMSHQHLPRACAAP